MHPRNRYAAPHDFPALARTEPGLTDYLVTLPDGRISLDFTDPAAVRLLNRSLLRRDYGLTHWDLPAGYLCPGVPGRLDYVHALADLLGASAAERQHTDVRGLDIGTGASLIYPILAVREYGWRMVGVDVDERSLKVAGAIIKFNQSALGGRISLRRQPQKTAVFHGVVGPEETFTFTMCNPPFFEDTAAAGAAAQRKWEKLGKASPRAEATLNFGGSVSELSTPGGEPAFLRRMIRESADYRNQVKWFTTLVSKKGYLRIADQELARLGHPRTEILPIGQGGKRRRILCWTFSQH